MTTKTEDVYKDKTQDADDAYDAARYGIASYINPGERPLIDATLPNAGDFAGGTGTSRLHRFDVCRRVPPASRHVRRFHV